MIPKTIHYCWFGNARKPKLAKKCIRSWKRHCDDFAFVEWNEDNFDILSSPNYVQQAYQSEKWAFVSDYVRLWCIYTYGGVYLDTDVELIRNIDHLLDYHAFFGFEFYNGNYYINTGEGFGAEAGTSILRRIMADYECIPFINEDGSNNLTACPQLNSKVFCSSGFTMNGKYQTNVDGVTLLLSEFFGPGLISRLYATPQTVSIHHYGGSWWRGDSHNDDGERRSLHHARMALLKDVAKRPIRNVVKYAIGVTRYEELKEWLRSHARRLRDWYGSLT